VFKNYTIVGEWGGRKGRQEAGEGRVEATGNKQQAGSKRQQAGDSRAALIVYKGAG